MRAKMAAIFAVGFTCGALFLAITLWFSGGLRTSSVIAGSKLSPPLAVPPAAPLPVPVPPVTAPPDNTPPAVITRPAVEENPPLWLHLAMPIAGIDPEALEDTFNE